jgi:hypothetical protein
MVFRKEPLLKIGGYSEQMWRNQDNDVNQRLRAESYRFFCTWKTQCVYYPKGTIRELLVHGFRGGFWNAISLESNPASMSFRHIAPFIFVLSLILTALCGVAGLALRSPMRELAAVPFAAIVIMHLLLGSFAAVQVMAQERFLGAAGLPIVFFAFHFAYGLGTTWAFVTWPRHRQSWRLADSA